MNAAEARSYTFPGSLIQTQRGYQMFCPTSARSVAVIAVALLSLAMSVTAFAQTGGKLEVAGFGGAAHLREGGGGTTKGVFGGRVGAATGGRVLVFGEFSYTPLEDFSGSVVGGGTTVARDISSHLLDFNGGVHYNLAPGRSAPYVLGAIGVGRISASSSTTVGTTTTSFDGSDTALGTSGGLGLRYFVGKNWGIQPEFRYTRYFFEGGGLNDFRFSGGLFFRFGE